MREFAFDPDGTGAGKSPESAAQENMRPALPRRFYKNVEVVECETGYTVELDGRPIKTPAKNRLDFPTEMAASLSGEEWRAQGESIDPATMPVNRLANTALDGVAANEQAVMEDIIRFAGTDLLCYRVAHPETLVKTQERHWDPVLDWAAEALNVQFETVCGVTHVEQDQAAIRAFSSRLASHRNPLKLACLHTMTALTGSALLALAVAEGELDADAAWQAAHVDEDFNISQWGEDYEAAQRRERRFVEMRAAAELIGSL
jgi:chaperone required for assembly of F1-ATPase